MNRKNTLFLITIFLFLSQFSTAICNGRIQDGDPQVVNQSTISGKSLSVIKINDIVVGNSVKFGSYEQDNDLSNGPEPIEWITLTIDKDKALLLSKYALDVKPYNETLESVTWENCTLRKWINEEFYNTAFNSNEKEYIFLSSIKNPNNPDYGTPGGNDTMDYFFLLSSDEKEKYISSRYDYLCEVTDYTVANGIDYIDDADIDKYEYIKPNMKNMTSWWLRTPGDNNIYAAYVEYSGRILEPGDTVTEKTMGVRPAFWLDLNSLNNAIPSDAETYKATSTPTIQPTQKINTPTTVPTIIPTITSTPSKSDNEEQDFSENCVLVLDIKSDVNWFNDTYDINVYFDNNLIKKLKNGERVVAEIQTTTGDHSLDFYKAEDKTVHKKIKITVDENQIYKCEIKSRKNKFDMLSESMNPYDIYNLPYSTPKVFLQLVEIDPLVYAKRAVITAITNYFSEDNHDIFGTLNPDKIHSYSDMSGDLNDYFIYAKDWGDWTEVSKNTWRGEKIRLVRIPYNFLPGFISATVKCNNTQCVVSDLADGRGRKLSDSMEIIESNEAFTVPMKLIQGERPELLLQSSTDNNYFPFMNAVRAIFVAFTNMYADDVFTSDGTDYDPAKFHDYTYRGVYAFHLVKGGSRNYSDDDVWHVSDMYISTAFNFEVKLSCDISYDGKNYTVYNVRYLTADPKYIDSNDPEKTSGWMRMNPDDFNVFLTIPAELVEDEKYTQEEKNRGDDSNRIILSPKSTPTPIPSENNPSDQKSYEIFNANDMGTVMRKKPMIASDVICTVKNGTTIQILGDVISGDGFTWREVKTESGLQGFINNAHIANVQNISFDENSYPKRNYKELLRLSDGYVDTRISIEGPVYQKLDSNDGSVVLLVKSYSNYDDGIYWITYNSKDITTDITENDWVVVFGICAGTHTYKTVGGENKTVPIVTAEKIEVDF